MYFLSSHPFDRCSRLRALHPRSSWSILYWQHCLQFQTIRILLEIHNTTSWKQYPGPLTECASIDGSYHWRPDISPVRPPLRRAKDNIYLLLSAYLSNKCVSYHCTLYSTRLKLTVSVVWTGGPATTPPLSIYTLALGCLPKVKHVTGSREDVYLP